MKKVQHERVNVMNPCMKKLASLLHHGIILDWRRLSELDRRHKSGDPDLHVEFVMDNILNILKVECKRDDGKGVVSDSQIDHKLKYKGCANVYYIIVESVKDMMDEMRDIGVFDSKEKEVAEIEYTP